MRGTIRLRSGSLLLAGMLAGALSLAPAWAGPNDPATKKFVKQKVKKVRMLAKELAADRYTKAEADAMFLGNPVVYVQGPTETVGPAATKIASAFCPTGTRAVGGGHSATNEEVIVTQSHPGGAVPGTTWVAIGTNTSGVDKFLSAWAVCASTTSTSGP